MFELSPPRRRRTRRAVGAGVALVAALSLTACETMTLRSEVVGSASAARVGTAIDISDDGLTMAVGESRARANTVADAGVVSVYVRTSTSATWTKQVTLVAPNSDKDSLFGADVALSDDGSRLVVGAPEYLGFGGAFVFTRTDETWDDGKRLILSSNSLEYAGSSVAVSGDGLVIAVGQQRRTITKNNVSYAAAGQVWVYEKIATGWAARAVISPSIPQQNGFFGSAVALSNTGAELFVGIPGWDQYSDSKKAIVADVGRVELFKRTANAWDFKLYLNPGDDVIGEGGLYGRAIAMSGNDATVVVGAPGVDQAKTNVGGMAVFNRKDNGWEKLTYTAGPGYDNGAAGTSVAISNDASHILLGIPGYENGVGAIALLEKKNGVYGLVEAYGSGAVAGLGSSVGLSGDDKVWAAGTPDIQEGAGGFRTFDAYSAPGAPNVLKAIAGVDSAAVLWTAPSSDGGLAPTYTVTSNPGGKTCSTIGFICTVTGLTNGTAYTFTVTATNAVGASPASAATAAVTPNAGSTELRELGTKPGEPRDLKVVAGWKRAMVTWSAPISNGGQAIQSYEVTATPGNKKCVTTETWCVITGLVAKKSYSFSVVAVNSLGASNEATSEKVGLQPKVSLRTGPKAATLAAWLGIATGIGEVTSMRLRGKEAKANCKIVDGRLIAKFAGSQCKVTVKSRYLKTLSRTLFIQTVRR